MEKSSKKKWYSWYFDTPLVTRILIALALGILCGIFVGKPIMVVEPLGTLMLKLLQMVVLPVIFFAIVMGTGASPISTTGRAAIRILIYYVFTTLFAAAAATVLCLIFKPGQGMTFSNLASDAAATEMETPAVSEFLLGMVPNNVFAAFANSSYLQVLVFALIFGIAISALRDTTDERVRNAVTAVYTVCEGGAEIMFMITRGVLQFTPFGIFALISCTIAEQGLELIKTAPVIIALCYAGYLFQLIVVYGTALKVNGIRPTKFFSKAKEVMAMAFSSRSSSSTLPVSIETAENDMGVSRSICGFTLPLGSQINLDGEAYYQVISVFTVAFASGIHFTVPQLILLIFVVTIAGTGTAGIAGSGPILLMAAMNMLGLDLSSGTVGASVYALILGIDVILDMGRTTVNVTGDLTGTCIVAKMEKKMDMSKWEEAKA